VDFEKQLKRVSPEVQIPIGAGQVDFEKQLKRVSPEVQNSPDRTIQIIEPADDYKGLF